MYQPSQPPTDPADLGRWALGELTQLARLINDGWRVVLIQPSYAEPSKPRDGMTVYADGTDWDPGSGEGPYQRVDGAWVFLGGGGGGGGGTVTSVALSLPATVFSITGSPVTTSGTLTGSFATQSANRVFAGPSSGGAAAPTFRALVAADIPALPYGTGTVTSVAATAPAAGFTISGSPITTAGTFTFTLADDLAAVEALATTGIARRTGASTWATGDLSGDATTSGTLAVTLANSGVTAATYTNPTVTFDAKGRATSAANGSTFAASEFVSYSLFGGF